MNSPKLSSRQNFNGNIYVRTPLIESVPLRKYCAYRKVYLKMENCQPSGIIMLYRLDTQEVVCPSGGNAGLATAYAAMKLKIPCHIIVGQKTPSIICDAVREYGATVERYGIVWEQANQHAIETTIDSKTAFLVHPFDHQAIWQGHSTIVDEIAQDLDGEIPSIIVTCCGGGGLLCGIVQGIRRHGWEKRTKILAMETKGTHSFNLCVKNGGRRTRLNEITSLVSSLAANEVCEKVVEYFRDNQPQILSRLITDVQAAETCVHFANDHRFLIGLACATSIAAVYTGIVERIITKNEDLHESLYDKRDEQEMTDNEGPIVVIVCGGCEISLNHLKEYRDLFGLNDI
ncbi:hypothetical protein HUG17_7042 [Dermatophagoides farinae]|uniref:L-serine ammonia-lyase n=1 Tax=Dermatophagoides farinae TaxID=6954 RepID=A0A9D4NP41_DERFA|nr:hypothetical protein HUG17_7042 [Dermatophagoides farinae]